MINIGLRRHPKEIKRKLSRNASESKTVLKYISILITESFVIWQF